MPIPDFKAILDGLPEKPPRSRLEPYRELILEMRRRGRPFREIAQVLAEKCCVRVAASTVYDFASAQSSPHGEPEAIKNSREKDHDEVDRQINALKAKKRAHPSMSAAKRFQFVSGEPLRLSKPPKKDTRSE